jgi:carbon monoxide dehydrogenase subunit G
MHRRRFLILPLACLFPLTSSATELELPEGGIQVAYENEMYVGRFSFLVPVPPAVAWETLTDFDRMAEVVPNLEASRILAKQNNVLLVAQRGRLDFGPFSFRFESERRVEMRQKEGLLISRAVSGTAKHMLSEMRLTSEASGTRLDYRLELIPDRWLPSSLGTGFMRRELAEQFTALAREMVRRQQGRHGT